MTVMDAARIEATTRVMKALARLVASEPLPVRTPDGRSPVVVTLPEDTVSFMAERLERAGGMANVVVAFPEHFSVAAFSGTTQSKSLDDVADVHHLSNMGMLLAWLQVQPNSTGTIAVRSNEPVAAPAPQVQEHEYAF